LRSEDLKLEKASSSLGESFIPEGENLFRYLGEVEGYFFSAIFVGEGY
jgi:hypothetical protein